MLPSPLLLALWNSGLNMVDVSASREGLTPAAAAAAAAVAASTAAVWLPIGRQ
jgi:hypothetical protein